MNTRTFGCIVCVSLLALAACGGGETAVRLTLVYEDGWELDELDVSANGQSVRTAPAHEVLVMVSEEWTGQEIRIEVLGLRAGRRHAMGIVAVTPVNASELRATLALSVIPCGAWCTEGATACAGDGVVVCEEQADGCMGFSAPLACSGAEPFCSLGVCGAECIDECAEGERRCAGPGGVEECGRGDFDSCLEWLPARSCPASESCSFGHCTSVCRDECQFGAVRCQDSGLSSCADRNFDGCSEWGPKEACAAGESCEAGVCRPVGECTDQCTANACIETSLTQCGNYDLDPCREPSPGVSCMPADTCMEGSCAPEGCVVTARVCAAPPAPSCIDASTLRSFSSSGTCNTGDCEYASTDTVCPEGCENGQCAGGACDTGIFDLSFFGNACFQ